MISQFPCVSRFPLLSLRTQGNFFFVKSILPARVVNSPVLAGGLIVHACGRGGGGRQMT